MSFRYLGNKSRLKTPIVREISLAIKPDQRPLVVDLFCGTASISTRLRELGYRVIANDNLLFCVVHARAQLLSIEEPEFACLFENERLLLNSAPLTTLIDTPYQRVLSTLNTLSPIQGFFYNEYSPSGIPTNGVPARKYFTADNAKRIDSIRAKVTSWWKSGWLNAVEHNILLHDLMLAVNDVANIAGTYGYFLASWSKSALLPLTLKRSLTSLAPVDHTVILGDALATAKKTPADIYYLDPPYNKRQYAAYYHILETIAHEDEPILIGKSGLRPWRDKSSDFCHKVRAPLAMRRLLDAIDAQFIFISYSEDGHIGHEQMMDLLRSRGNVQCLEIDYQRYISNGSAKTSGIKERLYRVESR